jgi:hypothetical protein
LGEELVEFGLMNLVVILLKEVVEQPLDLGDKAIVHVVQADVGFELFERFWLFLDLLWSVVLFFHPWRLLYFDSNRIIDLQNTTIFAPETGVTPVQKSWPLPKRFRVQSTAEDRNRLWM